METTVTKPHKFGTTTKNTQKLSKAGQWMQDHPDGIFEIVDRRAVNK
jgi:ABC-type nitrate/sulfonate/bicarbonate transport system substrate-binding protein